LGRFFLCRAGRRRSVSASLIVTGSNEQRRFEFEFVGDAGEPGARRRAHPENRDLLPGPRACRSRGGVAVAPSGALAHGARCRSCVTRCLNHNPLVLRTKDDIAGLPLQELLSAQPAVLISLIARLVGTPERSGPDLRMGWGKVGAVCQ
jgi:hypothetical protein